MQDDESESEAEEKSKTGAAGEEKTMYWGFWAGAQELLRRQVGKFVRRHGCFWTWRSWTLRCRASEVVSALSLAFYVTGQRAQKQIWDQRLGDDKVRRGGYQGVGATTELGRACARRVERKNDVLGPRSKGVFREKNGLPL